MSCQCSEDVVVDDVYCWCCCWWFGWYQHEAMAEDRCFFGGCVVLGSCQNNEIPRELEYQHAGVQVWQLTEENCAWGVSLSWWYFRHQGCQICEDWINLNSKIFPSIPFLEQKAQQGFSPASRWVFEHSTQLVARRWPMGSSARGNPVTSVLCAVPPWLGGRKPVQSHPLRRRMTSSTSSVVRKPLRQASKHTIPYCKKNVCCFLLGFMRKNEEGQLGNISGTWKRAKADVLNAKKNGMDLLLSYIWRTVSVATVTLEVALRHCLSGGGVGLRNPTQVKPLTR